MLIFTDAKAQGKSLQDYYSELCNNAYGFAEMYDRCVNHDCKYISIDIENVKSIPVCHEVDAIVLSTKKRKLNIDDSFWIKFPNLKYLFAEISDNRTVVKLDCSTEMKSLEYLSMDCNMGRFKLNKQRLFPSLKYCSLAVSEIDGNDYYSLFDLDSLVGIELIGTRENLQFEAARIPSNSCLENLGLYNIRVHDERLFRTLRCIRSIFYVGMSEELRNYFTSKEIKIGDVLKYEN